ncbi:MAG: ParB/RepB/Spo0J family partition protein [Candidatus Thorarchaeota archaeon]
MEVREIDISAIRVSELNVRKDLEAGTEDTDIGDLAKSIADQGLLSPITVVKSDDGNYDLIIGQRRYLACKKLGWTRIPAIIRDTMEETDAVVLSLIENVHRADVSPIDKARAYEKIYQKFENYDRVARETGVSVTTVRKYMKLLQLAPSIQNRIGTSSGPAGIDTLSRLARTFENEKDQERALAAISGFRSDIQSEILKRSEGDVAKVHDLRDQALAGAFDTYVCRSLQDCGFIPKELIPAVEKLMEQHEETGEADFKQLIRRIK